MNQEAFEKTLLNLNILATLRENDRLYTRTTGHTGIVDVRPPHNWAFVTRFANGESRMQNIEDVRNILGFAFIFLESLLHLKERYTCEMKRGEEEGFSSSYPRIGGECNVGGGGAVAPRPNYEAELRQTNIRFNRLTEGLCSAAEGIEKWVETYRGDVQTVAQLNALVSNISDHLRNAGIDHQPHIHH